MSEPEVDALTEVATIGSGRAATALAQLTERRTMIDVPQVRLSGPGGVQELVAVPDADVVAVTMQILGDVTGRTLFMLTVDDARGLCDLLMHRPAGTTTRLEELERSGLQEVGGILGSAYMDALSEFLGVMIMPSVPSLSVNRAAQILTTAYEGYTWESDHALSVQTDFTFMDGGRGLRGFFAFLPDFASLRAILDAVKLA
ncbi:MAG: chemotaxis protein CheC [Gemmatimonadales bacterium]